MIDSFAYTYDAAGQRVTETAPEAARTFGYDQYRQLTSTVTGPTDTLILSLGYTYDPIGNRTQVGRVVPAALPETTSYTTNLVNQYTALTGAVIDSPGYDLNGNTTSLVGMTLRYDEENRLVEVSDSAHTVNYVYDGLGRRVERGDYSGGALTGVAYFVYDGWRAVEELDASYATVVSYTRGLDLSGSFEGAGGIGGLLATARSDGGNPASASYVFDGNGNVTALAGADGAVLAQYRYDPFGGRLSATGAWADLNPYQFSSKERDAFTGFYYYGLRYYNPSIGRWLLRDPIEERGGIDLYGFLRNKPMSNSDAVGLALTRYTDSTDALQLTPAGSDIFMKPSTLGLTIPDWPTGVATAQGSGVKVDGRLSLNLYIRRGHREDEMGADRQLTIGQHERIHAVFHKIMWNSNASLVDVWEGTYNSPMCAGLAAGIANRQMEINRDLSGISNANFDVQAYGDDDAQDRLDFWTERLKQDQEAMSHHMAAYATANCCKL